MNRNLMTQTRVLEDLARFRELLSRWGIVLHPRDERAAFLACVEHLGSRREAEQCQRLLDGRSGL